MIGPYGIRRRTVRSHQPFPYYDDPVHMVGHHHEIPDIHMWHVLRYRIPTSLRPFTDRRRMHHAIRDVPEPIAAVIGAYRQVIRTALGIIVSRSSDRVALRQVGHGNPNIGFIGSTSPLSILRPHHSAMDPRDRRPALSHPPTSSSVQGFTRSTNRTRLYSGVQSNRCLSMPMWPAPNTTRMRSSGAVVMRWMLRKIRRLRLYQ